MFIHLFNQLHFQETTSVKRFISCINVLTLVFSLMFSLVALSKPKAKNNDLLKSLQYPELQVSPLASERLEIEFNKHEKNQWTNQLMFQVSGLATLLAALSVDADPGKEEALDDAKLAGTFVGAGWLIGMSIVAATYNPYNTHSEVNKLPGKTKRQQITKERLAEESLERPANLIRTLKWISWLTQLGASVYIMSEANDDTIAYPAIAAATSFLPLLFKHHWQHVSDQHRLYKKKIYGPIFSSGLLQTPDKKVIPGLMAFYQF